MKPFPWPDPERGLWPRGWYAEGRVGKCTANFVTKKPGCEKLIPEETPWYSPGEGKGCLCPRCVELDYLNEAEEEFYLQWLEDQAEISDAETEPGIIRVHNNTPWRVCVDGLFIRPHGYADIRAAYVHAVSPDTTEGFVTWTRDGDVVTFRGCNHKGEIV